ncbi:hypothetical protein GCM10010972_34340 [Cellulomonas carbonis]|nr:hypothetical protein GCM10010972_34340 [Cellulomonas carbonis]
MIEQGSVQIEDHRCKGHGVDPRTTDPLMADQAARSSADAPGRRQIRASVAALSAADPGEPDDAG